MGCNVDVISITHLWNIVKFMGWVANMLLKLFLQKRGAYYGEYGTTIERKRKNTLYYHCCKYLYFYSEKDKFLFFSLYYYSMYIDIATIMLISG